MKNENFRNRESQFLKSEVFSENVHIMNDVNRFLRNPESSKNLHPVFPEGRFFNSESPIESSDAQESEINEFELLEKKFSNISNVPIFPKFPNPNIPKNPLLRSSYTIGPKRERDYSKERARKLEKLHIIQPWSTKPSQFQSVPEHLWIIPCNENNLIKDTLFIISNQNNSRGCRFIFKGKTNQRELIFICSNCCNRQRKPQYAIIRYQSGEIFVDAQSDHVITCFRVDLKRALSSETGVLTNF